MTTPRAHRFFARNNRSKLTHQTDLREIAQTLEDCKNLEFLAALATQERMLPREVLEILTTTKERLEREIPAKCPKK